MKTFNIHEAKTQLSKLVELAANGEPFIIAKAGKPMVKVMAIDSPTRAKRLGFLEGEATIPANFDTMNADEIAKLLQSES
jgi:prevent-host-death family protein